MASPPSRVYERSGRIVLSLHGQYTETDARDCVHTATSLFRRLGKSEFVVDLRELSGYEPAARTVWQENLADFRASIHTVTMVGGSALARMTGAAVCLYAGIKMRFVQDVEEVFVSRPTTRPS
jgi:hypothetical protein